MLISAMLAAVSAQALTLDNRIVRAGPEGEDVAAYVAIGNDGEADRLVGVSCGCAEQVEIHRMAGEGAERRMEVAPGLPVPSGGTLEIRPGSPLHLMLLRLRAPIAAGQSVPITLRFERAGTVTAHFTAVENSVAAWAAAPPLLAPGLRPLGFLVGSCWRATFPNSTRTDTHCYTAMLGGRYIRDRHVVEGAPEPYSGETVYRWDPAAQRIRYDYYASDGGYSAGFADPTAAGIDFPEENYVGADGARLTLRNRLVRDGEGYAGTSSMREGDAWREMWTMRFTRVGDAPAD